MKHKYIIKNKTALILSCVFPGIGQIYKREYMKGIDLIIMQSIFISFLFYQTKMLYLLGVALIPTLWVGGMVDAGFLSSEAYIPERRNHPPNLPLRGKNKLLGKAIWLLAAIVFAVTAIFINDKLNSPKSEAMIAGKLKLLNRQEPVKTSDYSDSANAGSTVPDKLRLLKKAQNLPPEESAKPPPDIPKASTGLQTVNVEEETKSAPQRGQAEPSSFGVPEPAGKAFNYVIVAGAFSQQRYAEKLRLQIMKSRFAPSGKKGYQPLIAPVILSNNQKVHVVLISGFANISTAESIANNLKQRIDGCRYSFITTSDSFIETLTKDFAHKRLTRF